MTEPTAPAVHTADVVPYNLGVDHWRTGYGGAQFQAHSRHQGHQTRFTVLFVGPAGDCRLVQDGPRVPGPHAFLIAQASVISAHPGERVDVVDLAEGDVIEIRGLRFEMRDDRPSHDPRLYLVADAVRDTSSTA